MKLQRIIRCRRKRINAIEDTLRYGRRQAGTPQALIIGFQVQLVQATDIGRIGPGQRYVSVRGGLIMALKAMLACAPSATVGITLNPDLHRAIVTRGALLLDAALKAPALSFYDKAASALYTNGGLAITFIRTDATRTQLWQHHTHIT